MAKRLTDSTKWNDSWFTELPIDMKLVWIYILDMCDHAGVYKVNLKLLKFQTGTERSEDEIIDYLKDRIYPTDNDKWFIPKFITFQYKNFFTSKTPAIKSARELLLSHNIIKPNDNTLPTITKQLSNPSITLIEPLSNDYIRTKDMDMDKDIDKDIDKDMDKEIDKSNDTANNYGLYYKLYNKLTNYETPDNEYEDIYFDIQDEITWEKFFDVLKLSDKQKKLMDEVITIKLK